MLTRWGILAFFCLPFLIAPVSQAADSKISYQGEITLVVKSLPVFDDYPVEKLNSGKVAADIDFESYPDAWSFRTRLRNGLKQGANFAGHYVVVTHGCGSSCQSNWIVNVETGKVLGNIGTTYGAAYGKDSRLIVADLPIISGPVVFGDGNDHPTVYAIQYYQVLNDELVFIKKLNFQGLFGN